MEYTAELVRFQTSIKSAAFLCAHENADSPHPLFKYVIFLAAISTKTPQTLLAIAATPTYF
jgi:hypothetical protein